MKRVRKKPIDLTETIRRAVSSAATALDTATANKYREALWKLAQENAWLRSETDRVRGQRGQHVANEVQLRVGDLYVKGLSPDECAVVGCRLAVTHGLMIDGCHVWVCTHHRYALKPLPTVMPQDTPSLRFN